MSRMVDARQIFKKERVNLKKFEELIKIEKKTRKLNIIDEDFAARFNRLGKDECGTVNYRESYLCIMEAECALYCEEMGVLKCYYCCLEDYDKTHMYEYRSAKYESKSGTDCSRILNKYYKIEKINGYHEAPLSAYQLLYLNSKATNKEYTNARCYDRNSSFTASMLQSFISFEDLGSGMVQDGQIGFNNVDSEEDMILKQREVEFMPIWRGYADHRFKLREVPEGIKKFVNVYYDKKKNAKTLTERSDAKDILNLSVGCLQNRCWAYRALIVALSNEFIANLRDLVNKKYNGAVLFCNTDSICVDMNKCPNGCPELDILVGKELGQLKIEHEGRLYVSDSAYQWEGENPKWRGVRKARFERFEARFGHAFWLGSKEDNRLMETISPSETKWKLDDKNLKFVKYAEWERQK